MIDQNREFTEQMDDITNALGSTVDTLQDDELMGGFIFFFFLKTNKTIFIFHILMIRT